MGCNTDQLNDGKVWWELFIMPKIVGSTTGIHFTVLPFMSGTGEPVLCTIVFKSEQHISEIPVNWKMGIDLIVDDADDIQKVAAGRSTCSYLGERNPLFLWHFS